MAQIRLTVTSKVWIPLRPCQEVVLCLADGWEDNTVSGFAIIFGTVQNSGVRYLGSGAQPFAPTFENPRDEDLFQFEVSIDDTQITDIEETPLTCADIVEAAPYACLFRKLVAALEA